MVGVNSPVHVNPEIYLLIRFDLIAGISSCQPVKVMIPFSGEPAFVVKSKRRFT